jgi:hypothetical protein
MSSIVVSGSVAPFVVTAQSEPRAAKHEYARIGILTVFVAVLANVLVYFLGDLVIRYDPEFLVLGNPSGVAIFTFAAATVAVLVYAGLLRYTANPVRTFGIVSAIVFVVATIPDLTYIPSQDGASNGQTAILVLTHIVAAGVIVGMLTTRARTSKR